MRNYLKMVDISKTYDTHGNIVRALKGVNFSVKRGTVHGLLGENGAGKSTLMKILFGLEKKDSGKIYLDNQEVKTKNPCDAFNYGIGMVQQHFSLIEDFTVIENIFLNIEIDNRIGLVMREHEELAIKKLLQESGFIIDSSKKICELSMGQRQKVEILRILHRGADILILDEPTSVLTEQEIRDLFRVVRKLKERGKTIIFITHKVEEVLKICDEVTILRKGETAGTGETKKLDKKQIVQMIVGAPFLFEIKHRKHEAKEVLLSIKDLHIKKGDIETVKGVSFDVRAGEIVAIAGVSGNGQQEIVEAIFGLRNYLYGQILVESKNIRGMSPRERRKIGINYIPEDRLNVGSCMDATIMENLIIDKYYERSFSNNGCLNINKLEKFSTKLVNKYEVKTPSINNYVRNLSGGNIQRVIIAREIKPETKVLIACEPAMGLDIRSVKYVYDVLLNLREAQKAILLLASDLDEVISLVDRIIVMYKGKITAYMNNPELFDKKEIGEYMLGIKT